MEIFREKLEVQDQSHPTLDLRFHHFEQLVAFITFLKSEKKNYQVLTTQDEVGLVENYVSTRIKRFKGIIDGYSEQINLYSELLESLTLMSSDQEFFRTFISFINCICYHSALYTLKVYKDEEIPKHIRFLDILSFSIIEVFGPNVLPRSSWDGVEKFSIERIRANRFDTKKLEKDLSRIVFGLGIEETESIIKLLKLIFAYDARNKGHLILVNLLNGFGSLEQHINEEIAYRRERIAYYNEFGLDSEEFTQDHFNKLFFFYLRIFRHLRQNSEGVVTFVFNKDGVCHSTIKSKPDGTKHCDEKVPMNRNKDTAYARFLASLDESRKSKNFDIKSEKGSVNLPIKVLLNSRFLNNPILRQIY